jgi:hypothetical protein
MTRILVKSVAAAVVLIVATPPLASAEAPDLTNGRAYFNKGWFPAAFDTLARYRAKAGPSLEVDFMMGASACRIAYANFPIQGQATLKNLGRRYALSGDWPRRIGDRLNTCGQNLQRPTANLAVAGTSGTFMEAFPLDLAAPADAMASGAADRGALSSPSSQTLKSDKLSEVGIAGVALKGQVQAPAAANLKAGTMNRQ